MESGPKMRPKNKVSPFAAPPFYSFGCMSRENDLEKIFFSHREAEQSLETFARNRRDKTPLSGSLDDLTLSELIRNQHEIFTAIFHDIRKDEFELAPAKQVPVYSGKQRIIHKFPLLEQFVLTHFARCLAMILEPLFPDSLFSFRPGRGNIGAIRRVTTYMQSHLGPFYVLRRDVQSFGDSLVHEHVLKDFDTYFPQSPHLRRLLESVCRFRLESGEENTLGLPTGSYLQLLFENMYLLDLDTALDSIPDSVHIRFGDDILFLSSDRASFETAKKHTEKIGAARMLSFHPTKSENILLVPSHAVTSARATERSLTSQHHFDYLGMRVFSDARMSLSIKKQRTIQDEIRFLIRSTAKNSSAVCSKDELRVILVSAVKELLSTPTRFTKSPLRNYLSMSSDIEQLKELDRWIALQILRAVHGEGFSKAHFKNSSWKDLRSLGLPSLVHHRRTHE